MPPRTLDWLRRVLTAPPPPAGAGQPLAFGPPALPPAVMVALRAALARRLSGVPGLTGAALAAAVWPDDAPGPGHLLALAGVAGRDQPPLARSVAEALAFAGLPPGAVDLAFVAPATLARIAAQGQALDLPQPAPDPAPATPAAPGMDPARPPRLR